MLVIACAPVRVISVVRKPSKKRHWRQRSSFPREISDDRIEQLNGDISNYKCINEKLKRIVTWNIHVTSNILKNSQDILEILEDL